MEKCKDCGGIIVCLMAPYKWEACGILFTYWGKLILGIKQCFSCKKTVETLCTEELIL